MATTTQPRLRWVVLTGLAAAVLAVAACGDNNSSGNDTETPSPNRTGSTDQPITVPVLDAAGLTPQVASTLMEDDLIEQCGGELCVDLEVQPTDETAELCQFVGTEPPAGTEVPRGGTIVIVAGTKPCTSPSATPTGSPSPGASPTTTPTASPTPSPTRSPTTSPTTSPTPSPMTGN